MPIFEYECRGCGHEFERLVRSGDTPTCPECNSADLEKLLSLSSVSTPAMRAAALQKARIAGRPKRRDQEIAHAEEVRQHMEEHTVTDRPMRKKKR